MSDLRIILADNLIKLRKANHLTQLELAQKLNYSDKAISKWEHGDTLPDIETLKTLADMYGVTVDALLTEEPIENKIDLKQTRRNFSNKIIITALAVTTVWLAAVVFFVYFAYTQQKYLWTSFIWALPASFVILLVFNSIWGKKKYVIAAITMLMWTLLLAIHLQFLDKSLWLIYILGIPGEIALILASQIKTNSK